MIVRGRDVLVNGAGPIGSLVVAAAKYRGAATVTAADISAASLAIARAMGADKTVESVRRRDPARRRRTGVRGIRRGRRARCRAAGHRPRRHPGPGRQPSRVTPVPAVLGDLVTREITWIGSYRFIDEITDAVAALADGLDLSPLITHTFNIDDAGTALAGRRRPDQWQQQSPVEAVVMSAAMMAPAPRAVVTLGETMALITAPSGRHLRGGTTLPVGIGGAESNVAIGLARLDVPSHLDQPRRRRCVRLPGHQGDPSGRCPRARGRRSRRPDRTDGQGTAARHALAGPVLPGRQCRLSILPGRPRFLGDRRRQGAAPHRNHPGTRPRPRSRRCAVPSRSPGKRGLWCRST